MAVTLAGAVAAYALGGHFIGGVAGLMNEHLALTRPSLLTGDQMLVALKVATIKVSELLVPWLIVLTGVAVVAPMGLSGWSFSTEVLKFKGERINPVAGMKRLFSARGLMELLKAMAKFLLVGTVAVLVLQWLADRFVGLGRQPIDTALAHAGWLMAVCFMLFSSALIVIAAVDIPFQLWDHAKKLRMTKQEVKDETKETEGRPEVRSRIRSLQQQLSRRRMLEDIPIASVVVTNPTHYAVALRYEAEEMDAPRVVAKGADLLALKIREIAVEHGVPVFEAPPLARALYQTTEVGDEIAERLYVGVAQVLTYVYQLDSYLARGGLEPEPPEITIPDEDTRA